MKVSGGEVDFKYDHSVYWPALEKLTTERRQQRKERWEKAGKIIGESEIYLWGGDEPSLANGTAVDTAVDATHPTTAVEGANTAPNGAAELVDGVDKLDIKEGEPVKAAA
jgi:X-X-X-Leu-X-X-Gly heptad repeat protein